METSKPLRKREMERGATDTLVFQELPAYSNARLNWVEECVVSEGKDGIGFIAVLGENDWELKTAMNSGI